MNILGEKIEGFSMPVCTAFQPFLFKGRQCYSLDINDIISKKDIKLKSGVNNGLTFLVDINSERHYGSFESKVESLKKLQSIRKPEKDEKDFLIYLDTLEPFQLFGGGELALTAIQKIKGTQSYYEYAEQTGICQNNETFLNCSAKDFTKLLLAECRCVPFELIQLIDKEKENVKICNPKERLCYNKIIADDYFCSKLPKSCIGFYMDIGWSEYKGNSTLTKDDKDAKAMIYEYEAHKGRMTASYLGSPFHVNKLATDAIKGRIFLSLFTRI